MSRLLPRLTALAVASGLVAASAAPALARHHRGRDLPPFAQPGKVAATDFAFARAAGEDGQWQAFADYAAPGAQLLGPAGPLDAATWLAQQSEPAKAIAWAPRTVWSSCDGTLAVSEGKFQQPDGIIGTYLTVWQLQLGKHDKRDYKWIFDLGVIDHPQPKPRAAQGPAPPGSIVVTGLNEIDGKIADCPNAPHSPIPGEDSGPPAPPTPAAVPAGIQHGGGTSRDRTLVWHWQEQPDGSARVTVSYLRHGAWQQVEDLTRPALK